jgi:antitoxin (DNA-binding transcriptional repressor) of toxin-antitoxin stability system
MEATTKDLRLNTRALLAATDRGEEVVITYRGQRRAKLVPWSEPGKSDNALSSADRHNPAFGIWRDRQDSVDELIRSMRRGRDLP